MVPNIYINLVHYSREFVITVIGITKVEIVVKMGSIKEFSTIMHLLISFIGLTPKIECEKN